MTISEFVKTLENREPNPDIIVWVDGFPLSEEEYEQFNVTNDFIQFLGDKIKSSKEVK